MCPNQQPRYNITDERAALLEQLQVWVDAVGDKEFRGGAAPDASDVAVFGALRGLAGVPLHAEVPESGRPPAERRW